MSDLFLKVLGSQESGYSGDKPDQRGPYILIPKPSRPLFPRLSEMRRNDQSPIICNTLSGAKIAVNLVYNNTKFFPNLGLSRMHDEYRIYWNAAFATELNLDRGVVLGLIWIKEVGEYKAFSVTPDQEHYSTWKKLAASNTLHPQVKIPKISPFIDIMNMTIRVKGNVKNKKEIFDSVASIATKQRQQQPGLEGDPAGVLATLIKSQKDYSDYLRQAYGGKCALRGAPLINESFVGLDAAHIQPHTRGGPLLPTNGILLSKDLHHAFEAGAFTLDGDGKVVVNPKVPSKSDLHKFNGNIIKPETEFEIFQPFAGYVDYHRTNFYDRY